MWKLARSTLRRTPSFMVSRKNPIKKPDKRARCLACDRHSCSCASRGRTVWSTWRSLNVGDKQPFLHDVEEREGLENIEVQLSSESAVQAKFRVQNVLPILGQ